jgi:quinol monooxygenase YgiN
MLIQSIHYTFSSADADRAGDMLKELQWRSREEPGVIEFKVGRSKERPAVFALWEEYRDEEALRSHVATEHFQRLAVNGIRLLAKERRAETVFSL